MTPEETGVVNQTASPKVVPASRAIPQHFPALDGLRGFAVLAVFLCHYGGGRHSGNGIVRAIGVLCSVGWTGVTLFFLLSGFLITGLLWDAKGDAHWFRNFYLRRALRIWPLYYGTLLLLLLWPLFDRRYDFHAVARVVAIHAAYLQNVPPFSQQWKLYPIPFFMEHYWTLAVEEQFYLLWPLLLFFARTRRKALLLCLGTIVFSLGFGYWNLSRAVPSLLWHSLPAHAGELGLGGALALAYRSNHWTRVKRCMQGLGFAGAVTFCAGMGLLSTWNDTTLFDNTWGVLAATVALAGLLSSALDAGKFERAFSVQWLRLLGGISFGAYLFHLLPVYAYNDLTRWMTGSSDGQFRFELARLLVVAAITVPVAWMSFRYYERPFLRLKQRFAVRRPALARVASRSGKERY